jgi:hypothetical protein
MLAGKRMLRRVLHRIWCDREHPYLLLQPESWLSKSRIAGILE